MKELLQKSRTEYTSKDWRQQCKKQKEKQIGREGSLAGNYSNQARRGTTSISDVSTAMNTMYGKYREFELLTKEDIYIYCDKHHRNLVK